MANLYTKFQDSSLSRSERHFMGCKILKWIRWPWPCPFQGRFTIRRVGLPMVNQYIKFEVSRCTHYKAMNGSAKCRKWGGLGWLEGTHAHQQCHHFIESIHDLSFNFNRNYALVLYCFWDIASYLSKVAAFNPPHLYLVPPSGVTPVEFCRDLWHQKTRVPKLLCGIVWAILHLSISVYFDLWQTDTWT